MSSNTKNTVFSVLIALLFATPFCVSGELMNGVNTAKLFYFYVIGTLTLFSASGYLSIKDAI